MLMIYNGNASMHLQDGWTALHSAVGNGQMDGASILLHRNPDIITQTDNVSKQIIASS